MFTTNTPQALLDCQTPEPTKTWHPVSHAFVRNTLINALASANLYPVDETYSVSNAVHEAKPVESAIAVGRLRFAAPDEQWAMEALWGNDIIKRRGAFYGLGEHTFICTNGMVIAETLLSRKRTSGVEDHLQQMATTVAKSIDRHEALNRGRRSRLERVTVNGNGLRGMVVRLAEEKIIPVSQILRVVAEFENPSYDYGFDSQSLLGLAAAVTHIAKGFSPTSQVTRTKALTDYLDKITA